MLLIITPEMATDPEISKHLDAAISYVGGRCETLFSGVYIKENLPRIGSHSISERIGWEINEMSKFLLREYYELCPNGVCQDLIN